MRLQNRLERLETTQAETMKKHNGFCIDDLNEETRQAMADAYAETLNCQRPDADAYQMELRARINAANSSGLGVKALCDGDLRAIVAAGANWDNLRDATSATHE